MNSAASISPVKRSPKACHVESSMQKTEADSPTAAVAATAAAAAATVPATTPTAAAAAATTTPSNDDKSKTERLNQTETNSDDGCPDDAATKLKRSKSKRSSTMSRKVRRGDTLRSVASSPEANSPLEPLSPNIEWASAKQAKKYEKFHKLFKLVPAAEFPFADFLCAYQSDKWTLHQGTLYITAEWFCFYSRILGKQRTIEIAIKDVVELSRERTMKIIPNAISISTESGRFVFSNLLSQNTTYQCCADVWRLVKERSVGPLEDFIEQTLPSPIESIGSVLSLPTDLSFKDDEPDLDELDAFDLPVQTPSSPSQLVRQQVVTAPKSSSPQEPTHDSFQVQGYWWMIMCHRVSGILSYIQTIPQVTFLLWFCLVTTVFLIYCTSLMSYRVIHLEDQLVSYQSSSVWSKVYQMNQYCHDGEARRISETFSTFMKIANDLNGSFSELVKQMHHDLDAE